MDTWDPKGRVTLAAHDASEELHGNSTKNEDIFRRNLDGQKHAIQAFEKVLNFQKTFHSSLEQNTSSENQSFPTNQKPGTIAKCR